MSNIVSSTIFCGRNIDKAKNQEKVSRYSVAVGQSKNVFDKVKHFKETQSVINNVKTVFNEVLSLDTKLEKSTKSALTSLSIFAENSKSLEYVGKAVDFAGKHVNQLICVSSGIDILKADDKEAAFVTNTTALMTMFGVEKLMKKHLDNIPKTKCMERITKKVLKFAEKKPFRGIPAIIHGVSFVIGSCTAYSIGEKFGKILIGKE